MAVVKPFQRLNVMRGILLVRITHMHLPRRHRQKQQSIYRTMADVLKFLLFDGAGNGSSNRATLQRLEIGHFVCADDKKSFSHQLVSVVVAP